MATSRERQYCEHDENTFKSAEAGGGGAPVFSRIPDEILMLVLRFLAVMVADDGPTTHPQGGETPPLGRRRYPVSHLLVVRSVCWKWRQCFETLSRSLIGSVPKYWWPDSGLYLYQMTSRRLESVQSMMSVDDNSDTEDDGQEESTGPRFQIRSNVDSELFGAHETSHSRCVVTPTTSGENTVTVQITFFSGNEALQFVCQNVGLERQRRRGYSGEIQLQGPLPDDGGYANLMWRCEAGVCVRISTTRGLFVWNGRPSVVDVETGQFYKLKEFNDYVVLHIRLVSRGKFVVVTRSPDGGGFLLHVVDASVSGSAPIVRCRTLQYRDIGGKGGFEVPAFIDTEGKFVVLLQRRDSLTFGESALMVAVYTNNRKSRRFCTAATGCQYGAELHVVRGGSQPGLYILRPSVDATGGLLGLGDSAVVWKMDVDVG
jgi:hypothetical protein